MFVKFVPISDTRIVTSETAVSGFTSRVESTSRRTPPMSTPRLGEMAEMRALCQVNTQPRKACRVRRDVAPLLFPRCLRSLQVESSGSRQIETPGSLLELFSRKQDYTWTKNSHEPYPRCARAISGPRRTIRSTSRPTPFVWQNQGTSPQEEPRAHLKEGKYRTNPQRKRHAFQIVSSESTPQSRVDKKNPLHTERARDGDRNEWLLTSSHYIIVGSLGLTLRDIRPFHIALDTGLGHRVTWSFALPM